MQTNCEYLFLNFMHDWWWVFWQLLESKNCYRSHSLCCRIVLQPQYQRHGETMFIKRISSVAFFSRSFSILVHESWIKKHEIRILVWVCIRDESIVGCAHNSSAKIKYDLETRQFSVYHQHGVEKNEWKINTENSYCIIVGLNESKSSDTENERQPKSKSAHKTAIRSRIM